MGSSSLLCLHRLSSSSRIALLTILRLSPELNEKGKMIIPLNWKNSSIVRSLNFDTPTSNIVAPRFAIFHLARFVPRGNWIADSNLLLLRVCGCN